MNPVFYSHVRLETVPLDTVQAAYADWILGDGSARRARDNRLRAGVRPEWSRAELAQYATLHGDHDCLVEVRRDDDLALLRFTHRDGIDERVLWHNFVRGRRDGEGCQLEHAVARTWGRSMDAPPAAGTPKVFSALLRLAGNRLQPRGLCERTVQWLPEEEVASWADYILRDTDRDVPMVVLSPTDEGNLLVDPSALGTLLGGLVRVVALPNRASTYTLTHALTAAGFSRSFATFNGTVRIYEYPLLPDDDPYRHYAWIGPRLREIPEANRVLLVASGVSRLVTQRRIPAGFTAIIPTYDIERRRAQAQLVLDHAVKPSGPSAADAAVATLRTQLENALESQRWLESEAARLETDLATLREEAVRAEQQRDEKSALLLDLTRRLDEAKLTRRASLDQDLRDALAASMQRRASLKQTLIVLQALFPERLAILSTALDSAERSEFKYPDQASALLWKLATDYWEALNQGRGDTEARKVFGKSYAATESEVGEGNRRARQLRTFHYGDQILEMMQHLKIGVKPSVAETFRCYFTWLAAEGRIIVGHCGAHLDLR